MSTVLIVVPRYGKEGEFYQIPLGIAYVAAAIRDAGYTVVGLNLNHVLGDVGDVVSDCVRQHKPDVIATGGLSVFIDQINDIFRAAVRQSPNIYKVVGGGIVGAEPDVVLRAVEADVAVINEGEETIVELLDAKFKHRSSDLGGVQGIVFWNSNKKIQRTSERPQRKNLEDIPWADYEVLDLHKSLDTQRTLDQYFFHLDDEPRSIDMISSRSCPFKCTFCFHPTGKTYRERPLDDFFAELDQIVARYNVKSVAIIDELFSLKRRRLLEFCERIQPYKLSWMVQLHVNSASEETIEAMARSGCTYISYGIESMSQSVLDSMEKKSKKAKVDHALELTRRFKIGIQGNLLFGDSAETIDTANESMHWFANNREYQINLTPLIVFPGSPDYLAAVRDGLIKHEDRLDYVKSLPADLNISMMSDKDMDLVRFQVHIYFDSILRLVKHSSFRVVGYDRLRKARLYAIEWSCTTCSHENFYNRTLLPRHSFRHLRLTCRGCRERWDIRVPDRLAMGFVKHWLVKFFYFGDLLLELLTRPLRGKKPSRVIIKLFALYLRIARGWSPNARRIIALKHLSLDQFEAAIRQQAANVHHNPFSAREHFVLSRIYFEAGIFGGAAIHAKQSLELASLGLSAALEKNEAALMQRYAQNGGDNYFKRWSDELSPREALVGRLISKSAA